MATDAQVKAAKITGASIVIVAALGLIGQVIGILPSFFGSNNVAETSRPQTSSSVSRLPDPPTSSSASRAGTVPSPIDPDSETNADGVLDLQYLSDLEPVSNQFGTKVGSATIDHQVYPNSLWVAVGGCSESNHEIEYDIDQAAKKFTAWIGLNEESATGFVVHFQVYVDDLPYGPGLTKAVFEPAERIDAPVSGKHRIKLTATWVSGKPCRQSNVIGWATWADAQFVR